MSPEDEQNIDSDPNYTELASGELGHIEVV